MKNVTKNAAARRNLFDRALAYYGQESVGIVPQRTKLKAIAQLKDGEGVLNFLFSKDNSLRAAIEMLIGKSDLFLGQSLGIALMIEKDGEEGLAPLFSYPVPNGLALPLSLKGFENSSAFSIYNGFLSMRTGSTVNQSRLPLDECLYIPETQPVQIVDFAGAAYINAGILPAFNIQNVMIELEETLVISGTKNQPFKIEAPISADWGVPTGYKGYVVLIVDGWLLETGATEECKKVVNGVKNPFASMF